MLISAASVEADIHANRKVPANRRRINEAHRSEVALGGIERPFFVQIVILCFALAHFFSADRGLLGETFSSRKRDSRAIPQVRSMPPRRRRTQFQRHYSRADPAPLPPTPDVPP